jgi:hypothetical protein
MSRIKVNVSAVLNLTRPAFALIGAAVADDLVFGLDGLMV